MMFFQLAKKYINFSLTTTAMGAGIGAVKGIITSNREYEHTLEVHAEDLSSGAYNNRLPDRLEFERSYILLCAAYGAQTGALISGLPLLYPFYKAYKSIDENACDSSDSSPSVLKK